jgi:hypothetical protein
MSSQDRTGLAEAIRPEQMSRDFEVVLHVGYPKTASTWLQDTIFGNPDSGFVIPWENARAQAVASFVAVNPFSDDVESARDFFGEGLRRAAGAPGVPILSEETFCGDPIQRRYTGRDTADRLHSVFPRAKVLMGVREQKGMAISLYRQYILEWGVLPLELFLGRGDEPISFSPILRPDFLEFDRTVGYYQKLFGRENVLVLPIEQLQRDPQGFVGTILEFCKCQGRIERLQSPRQIGLSAGTLTLKRTLNKFMPVSPLSPHLTLPQRINNRACYAIDRLIPKSWQSPLERRWKNFAARRYAGLFRDSNRRLTEQTGIDFASLGYEV